MVLVCEAAAARWCAGTATVAVLSMAITIYLHAVERAGAIGSMQKSIASPEDQMAKLVQATPTVGRVERIGHRLEKLESSCINLRQFREEVLIRLTRIETQIQ